VTGWKSRSSHRSRQIDNVGAHHQGTNLANRSSRVQYRRNLPKKESWPQAASASASEWVVSVACQLRTWADAFRSLLLGVSALPSQLHWEAGVASTQLLPLWLGVWTQWGDVVR